jgi:hypothetical protein
MTSSGLLDHHHQRGNPMSAHGRTMVITTYTGGCGSGEVDVNPHVEAKIEAILTVSAELVNEEGATLARSGPLYSQTVYPGVDISCGRWHEPVPHGGIEVHVYGEMDGEVVKDTARCET